MSPMTGRLLRLEAHLTDCQTDPHGVLHAQSLRRAGCRAEQVALPSKLCTADEAAALVKDGDWLTVQGFVGTGLPEALLTALRRRFDSTGHPRALSLLMVASVGDRQGRGMDVLAQPGLLSRVIYGWAGNCPGFAKLVRAGLVQAWNIPLGVASHMIRDVAAGRPGPVTHVGLGTFVDPREKGGRLNAVTTDDIVQVVHLGGRELLWYRAPPALHVAFLRGTTADLDGNVSFEREALLCDALNQAAAARNCRGVVIVQVERVVERGSLPTRAVHLPGTLVDKIVISPPELHWQTLRGPSYDGSLSGEVRAPNSQLLPPLALDARRVIAHRAMLEISRPGMLVNLGVGMPEGVAAMVAACAATHPAATSVTLSTEAGAFGGIPSAGAGFGAAHNAAAHVPTATMIDFYNGGGIDLACLGMAEADCQGNVNVSSFGGDRMPGCGGFIDISQTAKSVLFVGTFTSGGLEVEVEGGQLRIVREGRTRKFRTAVHEKTFASQSGRGRRVLYITERAVFRLCEGTGEGAPCLELIEVAPGVDVQRDVLSHMDFVPGMTDVRFMDAAIFQPS